MSLSINPRISIVIPYYNHGALLLEALESLQNIPEHLIEVVVVNDGSNDPQSLEVLKIITQKKILLINQHNQGLGAARNNGIKEARGEYILPLDSDNKLTPDYVMAGINVLDADPTIGIVYGNPIFFGSQRKRWKSERFNNRSLLFGNYIDACAIFRKKVWEDLKGYDENMPRMGHEDWDFWIRAAGKGYKFHHLNKGMFYYRVLENSMIEGINSIGLTENWGYIIRKNAKDYAFCLENYSYTFGRIVKLSAFKFKLLRIFLKILSRF